MGFFLYLLNVFVLSVCLESFILQPLCSSSSCAMLTANLDYLRFTHVTVHESSTTVVCGLTASSSALDEVLLHAMLMARYGFQASAKMTQ